MLPEIVLFGLSFVSLGPLNIFPITYPPISEKIQRNTTKDKAIVKATVCNPKRVTQETKRSSLQNLFDRFRKE